MSFLIFKNFIFSIYLGILISIFSVFTVFGETSNKSLTEIFKPHWPYEAFWAIPSIDRIKPRLALKTGSDGRIVGRSRCVELDNLELGQLIAKSVGKKLKYKMVDFHSSRPGHDLRYALSGDFMEKLGWAPKVSIEKRIDQVVKWTLENNRWLKI